MEFLKYFNDYIVNENEGFGNSYFHEKKIDKSNCYFFKIGDQTEKERGIIIKIGKFSKNDIISDNESSYGVLSIEEIPTDDMDSFLVDKAPYKSREEEKISLTIEELTKISDILEKILYDYLQKNPKVVKIFDECLENIEMDASEYTNFITNTVSVWSKGRWSAQQGNGSKSIVYSKLSHN
jgi:hypothetical protein